MIDLFTYVSSFSRPGVAEQVLVFGVAFIIHILRTVIGNRSLSIARENATPSKPTRYSPQEQQRIKSDSWYAFYYFFVFSWGTYLLTRYTGWVNIQENPCGDSVGSDEAFLVFPWLYVYYIVQTAFYIEYLYAIVMGIDVKRKDAGAFIIHHFITISMIVLSRTHNYIVGFLYVLVIHDASDPFLHFAKMLKLRDQGNDKKSADVFFTVFAVSFLVMRLVVYPYVIIWNMMLFWRTTYPSDFPSVSSCGYCLNVYGVCVFLAIGLYCLHVYWGSIIIRMAYRKHALGIEEEEDPNIEKKQE